MDLVSAVVTTHNREPEIVKRAVDSIIHQTYGQIEIVVVDDSTADYPLKKEVEKTVCEMQENAGDRTIRYVKHDDCRGACAARNTGMKYCSGKYIGFLDDDDEWLPEKVEKMLPAFDSEDIALVYCDNVLWNETKQTSVTISRKKHKGDIFESLIKDNYIGSASFPIMRFDALASVDGFDEKLESSQDFDVWLRLSQKYKVNYVEEPLVRYCVHEGEQITKNPRKKLSGSERIIEKNKAYIDAHAEVYWYRYMKLIPHLLRINERKRAFRIWRKCIFKCPFKIKSNIRYLSMFLKKVAS